MTLNKRFKVVSILVLITLPIACNTLPPTPAVDIYHGTPPPTNTHDDALHEPVLQPTMLTRGAVQVPGRWDMNGDGVVDVNDVDIAAGDLAAMTSWLKMHGRVVTVTVGAE